MALTKEITKGDVKASSGNYLIELVVIVKDDGVEVGRHSCRIDYRPGDDIPTAVQKCKEKMQEYVNTVKTERTYYHAATLDTAIDWLNANVTV